MSSSSHSLAKQNLPGKPISYWIDSTPTSHFPSLPSEDKVDVAVIGGGIVGLTTAYYLKTAGLKVAVIEANRILEGVTGNTTAKITSAHGLIYSQLSEIHGPEKARLYGKANEWAISEIENLSKQLAIDCDFIRRSAYTYATTLESVAALRSEVEVAQKLGLPASFTPSISLPFSTQGAVCFSNQAQFHPRKYLLGLAKAIEGENGAIYEQSRVIELVEGSPYIIKTAQGQLTADQVVIATHFPILDTGLYSSRLFPRRSYVIAITSEDPLPTGMSIGVEPGTYSFRTQKGEEGDLLLIGGEGHKVGEGGDTAARYRRLEEFAQKHFPVKSFEYRWSTQDNDSLDHLPYIGYYKPTSQNLLVATGFGGWGMTNGTVAGRILTDLIIGKENYWSPVFDPNRLSQLTQVKELASKNSQNASHFVMDRFQTEADKEQSGLAPGQGKIITKKGKKLAISKDENGNLKVHSAVCTHLGCLVNWNSAEKSWDCPCHGSRFTEDGKVLHSPAVTDLPVESI